MKKGISLIVLTITVLVLTILTGIIVFNGNYIYSDTELTKLQMDISRLESLMRTYKIRNNGNIPFETTKIDVSNFISDELEQFDEEVIVNNEIELYVIDLYEIDAENVNYGNLKDGSNDRYLYSNVTEKVYYEQGIKIDDVTYYYVTVKNGEE